MTHRLAGVLLAVLVAPALATSQVPFHPTPDWVSEDVSSITTGAGWGDVNRDGWLDFVVANGNDIRRQRVAVYYNLGDGNLERAPGWQSADIDYCGHLALGDINQDGWLDVAVSVYLGPNGFGDPGKVKVYLGNGTGKFESTPSWESADRFYTFRCALGDADGDGDLDLAVAAGEAYTNTPQKNRIYFNVDGVVERTPRWLSEESESSYGVAWADVDQDGDLDLAFANSGAPDRVYFNQSGVLATRAGWSSKETDNGNTLAFGDINGDGFPELAVANNAQLNGSGYYRIYANQNGQLSSAATWQSDHHGYGSHVSFADVDADGDEDLIAGDWWGQVSMYVNQNGQFDPTATWISATTSVVENICWGDVDKDALRHLRWTGDGDGWKKLFSPGRRHLWAIDSVQIGGQLLLDWLYCYSLDDGWIGFRDAPPAGRANIVIAYTASEDLDFAVSNWDSDKGNYLFRNLTNPTSVRGKMAENSLESVAWLRNYPNPFNSSTMIRYVVPEASRVMITVFNLLGQEVRTLLDEAKMPGEYAVTWDGKSNHARAVPSGLYFVMLQSKGLSKTLKLLVMR